MTFKAVKGAIERMLDKNLQDLVRGIRNHKEDEAKYIAECLDEIKCELKLDNLAAKANAINKLIYLQMLGNDINWAAFNIIEVMSSTKFTYKRIGYLAAAQSFHEQTDVLMLTTNLIRKDLNSPNYYETGIALSGLACFITPDLARDLASDIMTLMTSTKPYIRKKAVLLMYKVFLKFPDALRPAFPRLKEKLEDPDPGVQSAAVNVICELARKNPKNYLSLAPLFFKLMNSSNNNWVLIKIIKLFGALTPLEPRLGKKLIEPLTNLIHSTSAMSLLYECINTVIAGIPDHSASIQLCVQKLRILIEDSDQNLKYLGLLAMTKILKSHPKSVQTHKDLILNCLDDKDESIRLRALDLLYGMISKKNIMEIVKKLMTHMDKAEGSHYRNELLVKIIEITSQNNYHYITNFEWYITILVELTRIDGIKNGELIAAQLLDVAIRVPTVRDFTVNQMANILHTSSELLANSKQSGICEVIYAAAWICGEYAEYLVSPKKTLDQMIQPTVASLPGHIQSVLVQNTLKLYCRLLLKLESLSTPEESVTKSDDSCIELTQLVLDKMALLVHSADLEVQERAVSSHQLLRYVLKQQKTQLCGSEVGALFGGEINPVTNKAQRRVPIPEGLDLDAWINEPPSPIVSEDDDESISSNKVSHKKKKKKSDKSRNKTHGIFVNTETSEIPKVEITEEEIEQMRQMRLREQELNVNYLKDLESTNGYINLGASDEPPALEPIENLIGTDALNNLKNSKEFPNSDYYMKQHNLKCERTQRRNIEKKKKKHKKAKGAKENVENEEDDEEEGTRHIIKLNFDVPEGIDPEKEDNDKDNIDLTDPHRLLNIDLEKPLTEQEKLPIKGHRVVENAKVKPESELEPVKEKKVKRTKEKTKNSLKEKASKKDKSTNENKEPKPKKSEHKKKSIDKGEHVEKSKSTEPKVVNEKKSKQEIKNSKADVDDPFSEWLKNDTHIGKDAVTVKKNNCFYNLTPVKIDSTEFAQLLGSGSLQQKSRIKLKTNILISDFKSLIQMICKEARFSIVEEIQSTASMYTKSCQGNHLCLLIKVMDNNSCVTIEAKSDNETLVEDVTKSLKHLVRNHFTIAAQSSLS